MNAPPATQLLPCLRRRHGLALAAWLVARRSAAEATVRIAWDDYPPYQRLVSEQGHGRLQGLDIELAERIAQQAGLAVQWTRMPWARQLESLQDGSLDLSLAASRVADREAYALWTQPYRPERAALLALRTSVRSPASLADLRGQRIGLIRGTAYPGEFQEALKDPAFVAQLVPLRHGEQGLRMLRAGRLDLLIDDPVTHRHLARRDGLPPLAVVRWVFRGEARLMLCRRTEAARPGLLAALNAAIGTLQANGTLRALMKDYPELLDA